MIKRDFKRTSTTSRLSSLISDNSSISFGTSFAGKQKVSPRNSSAAYAGNAKTDESVSKIAGIAGFIFDLCKICLCNP